eukprot:TRINITY_DN3217_c0_g3_i1.p2 TRINITY_DN3217_c0_g3~~TRINITY_DN3217_c0_g3_i1.p2  ORF type:complete len:177 (-),score=14.13 TRINITY_DN3217_c0_g3_i1:176-706(-)
MRNTTLNQNFQFKISNFINFSPQFATLKKNNNYLISTLSRKKNPSVQVRQKLKIRNQQQLNLNGYKLSHEDILKKYGWKFDQKIVLGKGQIVELPINLIRRPFQKTRQYDQEKIRALMQSIQEIGLQEPIDILEVDGKYYGFSGCHRYEAHVNLGMETIKCRVRKANKATLKMHMM